MKLGKKLTALCLSAAMLCGVMLSAGAVGAEQKATEKKLSVAVIADPQYCLDSSKMEPYSGVLYDESAAIFDKAIEMVKEKKPDLLLVIGNLTANGTKAEFEAVEKKLSEVKAAGIKVNVQMGAIDILNAQGAPGGMDEFLKVFKNYGYSDALALNPKEENVHEQSYLYVTRPVDGVSFVYMTDMLLINTSLPNWIEEQIKNAEKRGDIVIGIASSSVSGQKNPELKRYLDEIAQAYADSGLDYLFSSDESHMNEISKFTSDKGNSFYDIQTNSVTGYGSPVRFIDITTGIGSDGKHFEQLDIKTKRIESLTFEGETIADLQKYAFDKIFPTDVREGVKLIINEAGGLSINQAMNELIDEALGIQLDAYGHIQNPIAAKEAIAPMINELLKTLPGSKDQAIKISYNYSMYIDAQGAIVVFDKKGREVHMTGESIADWFVSILDDLLWTLNSPEYKQIIEDSIVEAFRVPLSVNEKFSVYDMMRILWAGRAYGEEDTTNPEWLRNYICDDAAMEELVTLMNEQSMQTQDKMTAELLKGIGTYGYKLIWANPDDPDAVALQDEIIGKFGDNLYEMSERLSKIEGAIPGEEEGPAFDIGDFGGFEYFPAELYDLCFDSNYKQDNNTIIQVGTLPEGKGPGTTDPGKLPTGDSGVAGVCVLLGLSCAALLGLGLRKRK